MYIFLRIREELFLYIGATKDLKTRLSLHRKGKGAHFTKKYKVHDLLYFEEFIEYEEAFVREKTTQKLEKRMEMEFNKN